MTNSNCLNFTNKTDRGSKQTKIIHTMTLQRFLIFQVPSTKVMEGLAPSIEAQDPVK